MKVKVKVKTSYAKNRFKTVSGRVGWQWKTRQAVFFNSF